MFKPKTIHRIEGIDFAGKSMESIAAEYQKEVNDLGEGGYSIRAIIGVGERGLLVHGEKLEMPNPADILQAIMSGNMPPGFITMPAPNQKPDEEYTPSPDFMQFFGPIADTWRALPPVTEKQVLPVLFEKMTAQMPVPKMREFAEELPKMIAHHKQHCDGGSPDSPCTFVPFFEEVQKRLLEKARLNTQ
jgi:hypothetical protein